MTELGNIFAELGISHYLQEFLEQGFDTWETILDITESDFDALGVKLGHRRKLQRRIANSRGLSSDCALASPRITPSEDRVEDSKAAGAKAEAKELNGNGTAGSGGPHGAKRKYRRHPKPDENAPERPPSAYVIFSNKMREELKGRNLSFTEIAKLVGENWQNLSPGEKEPYEQQAFSAKERYNGELAEYKKTDQYKEYSQYLIDFRSKHSSSQQGVPAEAASEVEAVKRPKLEAHASAISSGTTSSTSSQNGVDHPNARARVGSSASISAQSHQTENRTPPQITIMPKLTLALGVAKSQSSPKHTSPTLLPGYRDSIFRGPPHSLPWRDGQRDELLQQLPRQSGAGENSQPDAPRQNGRRTSLGQGPPPPLLTSESTNRSTGSTASTASSTYFTPRTPMEPPFERALPIPAIYSQKGNFDNQLPPLRPPSLSPQSTVAGIQHSPNSTNSWGDFHQPSMPPMRGYNTSQQMAHPDPDSRYRYFMSSSTSDENLDPVSALIRAGEIVNRNSRHRSGS